MFADFYYMTSKRVSKKADLRSLNFVTDRLFIKLFRTNQIVSAAF